MNSCLNRFLAPAIAALRRQPGSWDRQQVLDFLETLTDEARD
jgi:hypothetical protein